ncbi:MAG: AmmeMemoRadiSam system radical SAM enzyme [Desulfuromonas sp.]|nr:AmmeMemoRadiSam system radical SAM enzyme [Desulfuromonas sp.]
MHEAMFWTAAADGGVRCELCRFHCLIGEGQRGRCQVRENIAGVLYTLNYGLAVASNIDPIEKKPLFHVLPGSESYSVAAMGCNFHCLHCQNASISQVLPRVNDVVGSRLQPEKIVAQALAAGCKSIAYTYTEPTVFYEYAYATAKLAHAAGLANILVTNGYMAPEPLRQFAPFLTAANVDLKGFNPDFYRKLCGADLEQVMQSLLLYRELGIWLEVTTLIIPGYNDARDELVKLAAFIVDKLGADTPWHVSAFYPTSLLSG